MSPHVYLVIPAYKEATVIGEVLASLQSHGYRHIIVVDDGSTDDTLRNLKSQISRPKGDRPLVENVKYTDQNSNLYVVSHMLNRGKGAAVKTGIEAAKILGADIVVTFDADGQHDSKDIAHLVKKIEEGYDVVLGKRNFNDIHIPLLKRMANRVGNALTWLIYGLWVQDSQSGLRAYSKRALSCIETSSDRYEYDSEVIREIARNKLKWCEAEITVHYTKYSQGKMNKQNMVNGMKTLIKMVLSG